MRRLLTHRNSGTWHVIYGYKVAPRANRSRSHTGTRIPHNSNPALSVAAGRSARGAASGPRPPALRRSARASSESSGPTTTTGFQPKSSPEQSPSLYLGSNRTCYLQQPGVELEGSAVADLVLEPEGFQAPRRTVHRLHLDDAVAHCGGRAHRRLVLTEGFLRRRQSSGWASLARKYSRLCRIFFGRCRP